MIDGDNDEREKKLNRFMSHTSPQQWRHFEWRHHYDDKKKSTSLKWWTEDEKMMILSWWQTTVRKNKMSRFFFSIFISRNFIFKSTGVIAEIWRNRIPAINMRLTFQNILFYRSVSFSHTKTQKVFDEPNMRIFQDF